MSLEQALEKSMTNVPECLAVGYLDVETGMLLAETMMPGFSSDVFDTLAGAMTDMLLGDEFARLDNHMAQGDPNEPSESYFQEFLVFNQQYLNVFMRTKQYPNHVVCYICNKLANPGMVLTKSRMDLDTITAAV
ncbi:hypothetical protein [Pseudaestuariivita rosea]|uniref:hypothetical protein n=1 Tax=Pseudaestuariivita rosea TaxID=2763263 RepID=UPI001ABB98FB|nr:hypothetical protein [Pseudaestuariivita rosea]